jgi:hypothetical protein
MPLLYCYQPEETDPVIQVILAKTACKSQGNLPADHPGYQLLDAHADTRSFSHGLNPTITDKIR